MDTTADGTSDAVRERRADPPARGGRGTRPGSGAVDAAGVAMLCCTAVWALVSAAGTDGRPEGVLLALLAVAAGYAAGRVLGALLPVLTLATGAVAVLALVLLPPSRFAPGRHAPPLGYHNADAALLVLACGAACCAAWGAPGPVPRTALRLVGVGAAVASLALGSAAGFVTCSATVLCSLAAARTRRGLGLAGLALAVALVAGTSYAIAVNALPAGLSESLTGQLTQPRVQLWHEAVVLAERHPLRGVGPQRFSLAVTPLPTDVSLTQTPQSAPLQVAAEQGVPGVALLGGAYAWTLWALWRSPRTTPVVLTSAAALTGLALLATVDHVLSFATVTASAGLLAGLTTSRPFPD